MEFMVDVLLFSHSLINLYMILRFATLTSKQDWVCHCLLCHILQNVEIEPIELQGHTIPTGYHHAERCAVSIWYHDVCQHYHFDVVDDTESTSMDTK
jgi:hypothetical protein